MQDATVNINKLVSLTFDEDPEVRKKAASSLAAHGDPGALFALVELSYDKDQSVRETALKLLEQAKKNEPEVMSFAKIFSTPNKKTEEKKTVPRDSREKVLLPITQLFEKRLGKEKAALVKAKMMPTIERIYLKNKPSSKEKSSDGSRAAMQEFLTSYLEVISDLDHIGDGSQETLLEVTSEEIPSTEPIVSEAQTISEEPVLSTELEEVGMNTQVEGISAEIANLEMDQIEEFKEREGIEFLPDTFFKKAYELMMLSNGDDDLMRREMKRMKKEAENEITLAFTLAKNKFKEANITNITKIKDKMRNINTDPLLVRSVENMEYQKTKKIKAIVTRILVNDDEGNEGVVYLFEDRGIALQPGMKIKVQKALAKTFKFSGETALTLGKKSNIYIVL